VLFGVLFFQQVGLKTVYRNFYQCSWRCDLHNSDVSVGSYIRPHE
jgi:hypothetical protein